MEVSHVLVGGLTSVAVAWMIWAEIRSRRNLAAHQKNLVLAALAENEVPPTKGDGHRRKNPHRNAASRELARRSPL